MTTWKIGGTATLHSGGRVSGSGRIATELRRIVDGKPDVQALPVPMSKTPWAPASDYVLDCFAHHVACELGVPCDTDYVPDEADAPPDLRRRLEEWRRNANEVFVGTVH